ncbi:hypothetical protein ACSBR2_004037 [Camellia fascicularis]
MNILSWWNVQGALPGSVEEMLHWWAGDWVKKKVKLIWSASPLAVLWSLWKQRNACLFRNSTPILAEVRACLGHRMVVAA